MMYSITTDILMEAIPKATRKSVKVPLMCPMVCGQTDAQVGKKFGLATKTVKAMRLHQDVPFETIQILCHQLQCQPGDVLNAIEVYTIPAKGESPDAW